MGSSYSVNSTRNKKARYIREQCYVPKETQGWLCRGKKCCIMPASVYWSYMMHMNGDMKDSDTMDIEKIENKLTECWDLEKCCEFCEFDYAVDLWKRLNFAKKIQGLCEIHDPDLKERTRYVKDNYNISKLI